uniref:phage tail tape measure protein n=1 Tax=Clostridium sp. 12(A) TaxID=1163671 RepID=UPI00046695CE|nr:phage tail tape measure protein [Clostridium sp. 12(A)]
MANTDFKVLLQTVLDKSGINTELKEVQNIINKYSIDIIPELKTASLRNQLKAVSQEIASDFNKTFGTKLNGNDIFKAYEDQAKKVVKKNKIVEQSFADLRKSTYQSIGSKSSELQQMADMYRRESIEADKAAASASKISQAIDVGKNESKISTMTASFRQLGLSADQIQKELLNVNLAFEKLKANPDSSSLIANAKSLDVEYSKVNNRLKDLTANFKGFASETQRLTKAGNIVTWMENNSKASKKYGSDINQLVEKLKSADDLTVPELKKIEAEFMRIQISAREAGLLGKSFTDSIKDAGSKFTSWLSITSVIMAGANSFHKMYQSVYEVDTAMTNLYKVTDETDYKYAQFLNGAKKNAKDLGRTISGLVEQTADWAKLGYDIDESSELAKISSIYANVGEVDDKTAVSDLVTAMKAFNIEASNSINIVDSLNALGNKFAVDSAGLGTGLKNSASALQSAGNDINQTLAMLTGGSEIIQDASEMGNTLKVLSMRVRGMKGNLEELGEEYENVESISKIQTQILNRTDGAVNIFDDKGNFKSTYEIIKGISEVWDHISQTKQADLLEIIAGKQRGNQVMALLQSFQSGQVGKALQESLNSAGSAQQEQERWMESLDAKTKQFEASFQSLSLTVLNSDFLKILVDSSTALSSGLDGVIKNFGVLSTLLTGAGITSFVKNYG